MKMRKMGTYDGKDLYKSADGAMWVKGAEGKMSKLADGYDASKLSKAETEGDEEEIETEEDAEKSISVDDLRKSITALQAYAGSDRKAELLQKAKTGLDDTERQELFDLLGGKPEGDSLAKSVTEPLSGETSQAAFDVAPFLMEQHEALTKSLGTLADAIDGQGNREHEFNLVLAAAVADVGNLVKSMAEAQTSDLSAIRERLGIIETQPARAPKSAGIQGAQPMVKSFGEDGGSFDGLTKAQVAGTLNDMVEKGVNTIGGADITHVVARLENGGQITKQEFAEIKEHRSNAA